MYHDKPFLSRLRLLRRVLLVLLAAALVAVACAWGAGRIGADLSGPGADALKNAVLRSAVQCYAVEGYYPESLDYLTDHYGLRINHDRYIVVYEAFASNLPPQVTILLK